jgi:DNA-binding protein H-NS
MDEPEQGEVTAAVTPRLVFDESVTEDDIPAFLRKGKTPEREPGTPNPRKSRVIIPDAPAASVAEPTESDYRSDVRQPEGAVAAPVTDEAVSVREEDHINHDDATTNGDGSDLGDLSVEELQRRQEEIAAQIEAKRLAEKKAVIEQICHVVNTYKIPLDELVDALGGLKVKRKGVKATQKYQDPKTGATWSGRGKEPAWIRGKKREKFLIP